MIGTLKLTTYDNVMSYVDLCLTLNKQKVQIFTISTDECKNNKIDTKLYSSFFTVEITSYRSQLLISSRID